MPRRSLLGGANLVLSLALLAGLLAAVNWIASRHHVRRDLTAARSFTLAPQTKKVMAGLDRDVDIVAFYRSGDPEAEAVTDLGRELDDLSPRVRFEVVDPDRQPGRASRYPGLDYGMTVVDSGERNERVNGADEGKLLNAVIQVTRAEKKTIGFLTGHGERMATATDDHGYGALAERLASEGFAVETVQLGDRTAVPAEIDVLVIAGAEKALLPHEHAAITVFLADGGAAFILADPSPAADHAGLLAPYGLVPGADLVVDVSGVGKLFGADEFLPLGLEYRPHPIAQGFDLTTVFPRARSVAAAPEPPADVTATEIVFTAPASWAETEPDSRPIQIGPGDRQGPICVVAAASRRHAAPSTADSAPGAAAAAAVIDTAAGGETRIVLTGDSDFCANAYAGFGGNLDLALNALSWLAEEEDLIAIRPHERENRRVTLTAAEAGTVRTVALAGMPLLVLGIGLAVWWRRR